MPDDEFEGLEVSEMNDKNTYALGRVAGHYVIVGCLPAGVYGTVISQSTLCLDGWN